jgi:putative transposase
MAVPTRPNERWSLDFVHDQLANGRYIRILNIMYDYSQACVGQLVRYLNQLKETRCLPRTLVSIF